MLQARCIGFRLRTTLSAFSSRATPALLLGFGLLATVLVYWPGLDGEFMYDDNWNFVNNSAVHVEQLTPQALLAAASSGTAGPLGRPIAMTSFALNYYYSGLNASHYKITNLLIHLVNGVLVFFFARLVLAAAARAATPPAEQVQAGWIAAACACLWLLHPLNLTAVLYVVQRMTSLSTLFVLLAMVSYLYGRAQLQRDGSGWSMVLASVLLWMPLAAACKETGLLVPVYLLLIEWLLLRFSGLDTLNQRRLVCFHLVFLFLPALLSVVYIAIHPEIVSASYAYRPFSLEERLLTQGRVLWLYAQWILLPQLSGLGLFHDDIELSTSLLTPLSTLLAGLAWAVLIAAALRFRRRAPLLCFGVLFFLSAHLLESTVFSLLLVFEHRNYLAMIGLLLVLLECLSGLQGRLRWPLIALLAAYFAFTTSLRAANWGNLVQFSYAQYQHHPASAQSNYQLARVYASLQAQTPDVQQRRNFFVEAEALFTRATELRPPFVDGLFGLLVLYSSNALEPPAGVLSELSLRLRQQPVDNNVVNQFNNLAKCQSDGVCVLADGLLQSLAADASSNPRASSQVRTLLLRYVAD